MRHKSEQALRHFHGQISILIAFLWRFITSVSVCSLRRRVQYFVFLLRQAGLHAHIYIKAKSSGNLCRGADGLKRHFNGFNYPPISAR
jgi:hypothetical protein